MSSQGSKPRAVINQDKCDGALGCPAKRSCARSAIFELERTKGFFGGRATYAVNDLCTGCGVCVRYCPHNAISLR